jgi:hypothetical protein
MKEFKEKEYAKNIPVYKRNENMYVSLDPTGYGNDVLFHKFNKTIFWIPEITTKIDFYHGGEKVGNQAKYSDFNDYFGSLVSALEKKEYLKESYKMDKNSTLELRIILEVKIVPNLLSYKEHSSKYMSNFLEIPDKWSMCTRYSEYLHGMKDFSERFAYCEENNIKNYLQSNVVLEKEYYSSFSEDKKSISVEELKKEVDINVKKFFEKIDVLT